MLSTVVYWGQASLAKTLVLFLALRQNAKQRTNVLARLGGKPLGVVYIDLTFGGGLSYCNPVLYYHSA